MNDFDDIGTELHPETRHALRHRVATGQAEGRAPCLVAALVRDGELRWCGARGVAAPDGAAGAPDENTQFRIGSITKTFVAVLVMRLRDEGALALRDRLDAHLPAARTMPGVGSARIGELLAHTAGLTSETPAPWWERTSGAVRTAVADLLGDEAQLHDAGRHFHYSNPGFAMLGALVAHLRAMPWDEVVRREILTPLGMARTTPMPAAPHAQGWAVHPWADLLQPEPAHDAGLSGPAGQLWSTAADLARFATFLIDGAPDVLAPDTLAEMRVPAGPPTSTATGTSWESGYGLGLQIMRSNGRDLIGHTGSMPGFVACLWTSPVDGLAAIAFANSTSGPLVPSIAADLIDIVATREPRLPAPWQPALHADADLLAITGPWYWGPTPLALTLRGDDGLELTALVGRGRASRFRRQPDGTWRGLDGYYLGETLQVARDASGAVSHLDIGSFVFTRQPYEPGVAEDPVPGGVHPDGWTGTEDRF